MFKNFNSEQLYFYACCQRFAFTQVWVLKTVCPAAMLKKKCDYKIIEMFLRKSQAPNQS
jgi:hypothetical protein